MLTDDCKFPFGLHKGKRMKDVPSEYLDWMDGQPWSHKWPEVVDYIDRNRKAINLDLKHKDRE